MNRIEAASFEGRHVRPSTSTSSCHHIHNIDFHRYPSMSSFGRRSKWGLVLLIPLLACGEDTPTETRVDGEPPKDIQPPIAQISGPAFTYISYDNRAPIPVAADQSSGDIEEVRWWYEGPDGQVSDTLIGEEVEFNPTSIGEYVVHLEVIGPTGMRDRATLTTTVKESIMVPYPEEFTYVVSDGETVHTYIRRFDTGHARPLPVNAPWSGMPSLSSDGRYLVGSVAINRDSDLNVYDLQDGTTETISRYGIALEPKWHPSGEFLVYTNDVRVWDPWRGADEIAIAQKKAGSWEIHYPGGEDPNPFFYTQSLAWSKDGTRLAAGHTRWGDGSRSDPRRIAVFEDIAGDPVRYRVTTENQIEEFLRRHGSEIKNIIPSIIKMGNAGVSWSPDGRYIATGMALWDEEIGNRHWTVILDTEGQEPIRRVAQSSGMMVWSPGGNWIYFSCTIADRDNCSLEGPRSVRRVHVGGGERVYTVVDIGIVTNN